MLHSILWTMRSISFRSMLQFWRSISILQFWQSMRVNDYKRWIKESSMRLNLQFRSIWREINTILFKTFQRSSHFMIKVSTTSRSTSFCQASKTSSSFLRVSTEVILAMVSCSQSSSGTRSWRSGTRTIYCFDQAKNPHNGYQRISAWIQ